LLLSDISSGRKYGYWIFDIGGCNTAQTALGFHVVDISVQRFQAIAS